VTALAGKPAASAGSAQDDATVAAQTSPSVTLFLGGDVMTGRGIDHILPHPSEPTLYEPYVKDAGGYLKLAERISGPIPRPAAFDYIWGDALETLDAFEPDARIINLETAVTVSSEPWPGKGIHYRMHPLNTPCLTAARIDCCALANNHVLDWSYAGLEETLLSLDEAGIQAAGAGRALADARQPAVIGLPGGGRVLVYSICAHSSGVPPAWAASPTLPGVNFLMNLEPGEGGDITAAIIHDKRPGDIVVASVHWGGNWGYDIPDDQQAFARQLIAAGVDVVHGHSSHHAKGIEVVEGRPVLYGCGDLINDYEGITDSNQRYRGELPLLYFITLDGMTGALQRLVMKPMRILQFRLRDASRGQVQWLRKTLDREGQRLNTRVAVPKDGLLTLEWQ